jgi:hypothetical protein
MYKICRFMRHSGPAAYEPVHFFVSFLCASKEMKNTFTMLFLKAKFGGQKNKQKKPKEQSFGFFYLKYI